MRVRRRGDREEPREVPHIGGPCSCQGAVIEHPWSAGAGLGHHLPEAPGALHLPRGGQPWVVYGFKGRSEGVREGRKGRREGGKEEGREGKKAGREGGKEDGGRGRRREG